jgi:hypothetical protein
MGDGYRVGCINKNRSYAQERNGQEKTPVKMPVIILETQIMSQLKEEKKASY